MADERPTLPVIDFASVIVAPGLVMLMLGSLVFFLIEVIYAGQYESRLLYTFFFYVFGIVLVARIGIQFGSGKSWMYGLLISAACFVAMLAFVEYPEGVLKALGPVLNVGLMAIVWWAANKLTWDCTHLREDQKASGRGVLAAAGFDGTPSTTQAEDEEEYDPDRSAQVEQARRKKRKKKDAPPLGPLGWWQRFQAFREWRTKKPHTPGVWVLYFALAAIPLFALGQALIPADDTARRSATFWQMAVYVGSALGLLVTTTLMGLKRYLEDRGARIPTPLTVAWLGLGGAVILLFLGVGALLPRPHTETPLFTFQKGGKQDRDASKYAVVKDNAAGKGQGASGKRKEAGDGQTNAKGGKPGGKGDGQQSQGGGDKQGENGKGDKQGDKSGDGNKGNGNDQKNGDQKGNDQKGNDQKGNDAKDGSKGDGKKGDQSGNDKGNDGKADGDGGDADGNDHGESFADKLQDLSKGLDGVAEVVKWIVWIVLAVAVIGGGGYLLVKWMANFTGWAKGLLDWLRGLFGKKKIAAKAAAVAEAEAEAEVQRPPPFAAFSNPFTDGTAKRRDTAELVAYTFAAYDAWAWDRDLGRTPDETPTEFTARATEDYPELAEPSATLAGLYARALFSQSELPKDARPKLAQFWKALEGVSEAAGVR